MSLVPNLTQEIRRIEVNFLNVKREIKTLKNRIRAYKGWTTKYRRKQEQLKQDNLAITQQRDQAVQDLSDLQSKQESLLKEVAEARQAKELRDQALSQLDSIIDKIEQYREICIKANKILCTGQKKIKSLQSYTKRGFDEKVPH